MASQAWDDRWAHRFLSGDARAFEQARGFVELLVRRYANGAIPPAHREDVAGAVILNLLTCLPSRFTASPQAFIRKVTTARCIDFLRKHRLGAVEIPESHPAPDASPEERFVDAERARLLTRILLRLGPESRELIRLFHGEGLSYREIASRLGRSERGLRVTMARGIRKARKLHKEMTRERPAPLGVLQERRWITKKS